MKNELNIYEVGKEDDLKHYFSLYLKTQKKHGSPPHDFRLFQNLFRLNAGTSIKILIAEYGAKPIAGIIVFHNRRNIYWWGGVSDPKFRHLNATDVLLWKIIEWGNESGFTSLNLGRTRFGTGIYHFKKGWGGIEVPLSDYILAMKGKNAITPDPAEGKYQVLTELWSRLPMAFTRLIGPKIAKQIGL
jgi:predicted N-acyltransferase